MLFSCAHFAGLRVLQAVHHHKVEFPLSEEAFPVDCSRSDAVEILFHGGAVEVNPVTVRAVEIDVGNLKTVSHETLRDVSKRIVV